MNNTARTKYWRLANAALFSASLVLCTACMGGEPQQHMRSDIQTTVMKEQMLTPKQRAIPWVSSAATTGDMPRLNAALNSALNAGMAISELKEILVQLYAYAGFPRSLNALSELMNVLDTRRKQGIHDAPGREPSHDALVGDNLLAKGTENQTAIAGRRLEGPLFEFAPVINRFLRTHLFGDIFERDNLDWQSRELATVSALSSMPGLEAQLASHIKASINVGLSVEQLQQVAVVLGEVGNTEASGRCNEALLRYIAQATQH